MNEFHHYCKVIGDDVRREDVKTSEDKDKMFKNHDLFDDNLENLISFRDNLIDSIINEFNQYFPTEDFNFLRIFEPKLIPTNQLIVSTYGTSELNETCLIFGFENDVDVTKLQFKDLLFQIILSEFAPKKGCSRLSDFWSLQLRNLDIIWGQQIKRLIESVLSIPIGSSSCERGFSSMNYIKDKKRSHLNLLNLENLLRIKDIGPKNVKEFDAHYYALECSKNHWLTDQSLFCF